MNNSSDSEKGGFIANIFRKKCLDTMIKDSTTGQQVLKKTLGAFDLTILGIGAIIGAGIFTLAGTAAKGCATHVGAGPGLILSFALVGLICAITALCYAELASMIPIAGSAYTYTYTTLGEIVAWMIGWILMLEYAIGATAVACGWSGYFFKMLEGYQQALHLPDWLVHPPYWLAYDYYTAASKYIAAGIDPSSVIPSLTLGSLSIPISLNLGALFIVIIMSALLFVGIQESAKTARLIVLVKLLVIIVFIGVGALYFNAENWDPFLPNGFHGVLSGAFLVFFAYIGFDAVSTAAEETKNPHKDLPIGIIASLAVCTVLYMGVAGVLTGLVPMEMIDVDAPIAAAMSAVGHHWMAGLISIGAVAGLTSVVLVLLLGGSRILFAMSRDGLLPKKLSAIHPKFQTPHIITIVLGLIVVCGTVFLDINKAAELCNIGTLSAFTMVCIGTIILRFTDPERKRGFTVPFTPVLPVIGALLSLGLILYTLATIHMTLIFFSSWVVLGIITYFLYSKNKSVLNNKG